MPAGGCFTKVSRALQKYLAKIHNARNHIYGENFKLKLCTCAQSINFERISWRARETLVKQPPGSLNIKLWLNIPGPCGQRHDVHVVWSIPPWYWMLLKTLLSFDMEKGTDFFWYDRLQCMMTSFALDKTTALTNTASGSLDDTYWHANKSWHLPLRKPRTWQPNHTFNDYRPSIDCHGCHFGLRWQFAYGNGSQLNAIIANAPHWLSAIWGNQHFREKRLAGTVQTWLSTITLCKGRNHGILCDLIPWHTTLYTHTHIYIYIGSRDVFLNIA